MTTKTFTAKQFNATPAPIYRAADKGERVEISHDYYKDRTFVLKAEDKAPKGCEHDCDENNVCKKCGEQCYTFKLPKPYGSTAE